MALIDSGSSVNIISDTLYKLLRGPSQIRMCNKNIIAANNGEIACNGVSRYSNSTSKIYM